MRSHPAVPPRGWRGPRAGAGQRLDANGEGARSERRPCPLSADQGQFARPGGVDVGERRTWRSGRILPSGTAASVAARPGRTADRRPSGNPLVDAVAAGAGLLGPPPKVSGVSARSPAMATGEVAAGSTTGSSTGPLGGGELGARDPCLP